MKIFFFFRKWVEALVLTLIFLTPIITIGSFDSIEEIKKNWPSLRCNPANLIYYPLVSENMSADVNACINTTMRGSMGKMLQPLTYVYELLGNLGGQLNDQLQDLRQMFAFVRDAISQIVQSIFGIFLNLVIQFQSSMLTLKDIVAKVVGVFTVLLYTLDGSVLLMESGWNGVPGQMVRAMGKMKIGSCFANDTPIVKQNGETCRMDEVAIGDILENGSQVIATMKILNFYQEPFYQISSEDHFIYVTGTHHIFHKTKNQYVMVEEYEHAVKTERIDETLTCLITHNHQIPIHNDIFFDWEDQLLYETSSPPQLS